MSDDDEAFSRFAKRAAMMPLVLAYLAFADSFVLSKLWLWYAVPLGAISLRWQVFGALTLARFVVRNSPSGRKDDRPKHVQDFALFLAIALPWVALLIGWWWRG